MINSLRVRASSVARSRCGWTKLPWRVHLRVLRVGAIHRGHRATRSRGIQHGPDVRRPLRRIERVDARLLPYQTFVALDHGDGARHVCGQAIGEPVLDLHADGIHHLRQHGEFGDGKHGIHDLMRVVASDQPVPGAVTHDALRRGARRPREEQRFEPNPTGRVRPCSNPPQLLIGEARLPGRRRVMRPLVLGAAQPRGAQNQQLAMARGKGGLDRDVVGKRKDTLHEVRMIEKGPEIVRHVCHGAVAPVGVHQFTVKVGPLSFRQRENPRRCQRAGYEGQRRNG